MLSPGLPAPLNFVLLAACANLSVSAAAWICAWSRRCLWHERNEADVVTPASLSLHQRRTNDVLCMYALPAEGTCFYRQMTKSPNSFLWCSRQVRTRCALAIASFSLSSPPVRILFHHPLQSAPRNAHCATGFRQVSVKALNRQPNVGATQRIRMRKRMTARCTHKTAKCILHG